MSHQILPMDMHERRIRKACRCALESLEARRLFAAGDLDTSFSGDGKATIALGAGLTLESADVALQTDGKTVLVGTLRDANLSLPRFEFAVARLNLNGTPDVTFGPNGNGVVRTRIGPTNAYGSAVAIAPGGNIVVVGTAEFDEVGPNVNEFAVARYLPSGALDTSFDNDGIRQIEISDGLFGGNGAVAYDVALQSDGKIIVVGEADNYGDNDFAIARLNTDGSLDGSFDGDGKKFIGFGQNEGANGVALDYSGTPATNPLYGTIVLAGRSWNDSQSVRSTVAVARVNPNGSMATFGTDGRATYAHPNVVHSVAEDLVVESTGKIVIAGWVDPLTVPAASDFLIARFNANGTMDTGFGTGGTGGHRESFGGGIERAGGVIIRPADSRLIVVGSSRLTNSERFAIAKYTTSGALDTSFAGGAGWKLTTLAQPGDGAILEVGVARGPGKRFVVTGGAAMETARYLDAGANLVTVGTFNPYFSEPSGSTAFIVGRTEILPTPLRVYLGVGGTARFPGQHPITTPSDYIGANISFSNLFDPTYVDIPAGQSFTTVTITARDDTLFEGDETAIFTILPSASYEIGNPGGTTLVLRDNETIGGPLVNSSSYQFESTPRRLRFTFSQDVSGSINEADFQVTGPSGLPPYTFYYDQNTLTATLSFASILPDGNYSARVVAAGLANASGTVMPADHVLPFFVFAGDADRDRTVGISDFSILASRFNLPGTFSQGDFNYSGVVEIGDFSILASKFNTSLPASVEFSRGASTDRLASMGAPSLTTAPRPPKVIDLLSEPE